ncbi:hypothetical protein EES43_24750 [Streptomyces sp. ADI96-02]|uniref:hypothetical protein n=1 Tax=Streptomyces sp. ADI96-02 TaxID=1522760 RepID=UPI000F55288B|nr:hypothetical protein [Streptomyces sp. ADI96-02]RPK56256.1 hypothetical protein EES43_24750 [Streptomyces sp. ADI96-02]
MSGNAIFAGTLFTGLMTVVCAIIAARAARHAAADTREANRLSAEPNQRTADLEAFREIRSGLETRLAKVEDSDRSMRSLVRDFARYVSELTALMRLQDIEPPAPPERVDDYYRTGV